MPSKKGTKAKTQKQKQKQKQTVIVNINEKPKTKRKRKPTASMQRKPMGISSHQPLQQQQNNNGIRDVLFKLGQEQQKTNSIIEQVMATARSNPQAEILKDEQEKARLPNRPPAIMSETEAISIRSKAKANHESPFIFSDAEQRTEDLQRFESKLISPQTPLNAYLEQVSQHQNPIMHQPPPEIHIEEAPSGSESSGEVDYNTVNDYEAVYDASAPREPEVDFNTPRPGHGNAMAQYIQQTSEVGQTPIDFLNSREREEKETMGIQDYVNAIEETRLPRRFTEYEEPVPPELTENTGAVKSRFQTEAPEAFAIPLVETAGAQKVNPNTHPSLQLAGLRNADDAREALNTWNRSQPEANQINVWRGGNKGKKTIAELDAELEGKHMTFAGIKTFHDKNTKASPHKVQPRAVKEKKPTGPPLVQLKKQEPQIATPLLNLQRKVKGARFAKADEVKGPLHGARLKALTDETTGATEL